MACISSPWQLVHTDVTYTSDKQEGPDKILAPKLKELLKQPLEGRDRKKMMAEVQGPAWRLADLHVNCMAGRTVLDQSPSCCDSAGQGVGTVDTSAPLAQAEALQPQNRSFAT